MKLNIGRDFEVSFGQYFWILILVGFGWGWDFEVSAWLRFWRWNLTKICVWTCLDFGKKNSTLGSVVPLAMFTSKQFHRRKQWWGCFHLGSGWFDGSLWCTESLINQYYLYEFHRILVSDWADLRSLENLSFGINVHQIMWKRFLCSGYSTNHPWIMPKKKEFKSNCPNLWMRK